MSRRYVKKSKFNSLDEITPQIVSVVSAKDNIESAAQTQTYFKRNYLDAIRHIVPDFYFADEVEISGTHISYPNQLINSHILANKNQSTILPVSSLPYDHYLSSLNTPSGFAKYFYKQYNPAQITPDDFQRNFFDPINKKLSDYPTSASFLNYISGTFLPSIPSLDAGHHPTADLATLTNSAYAIDSSGTYKYLANHLGWLYFLNRLGPTGGFDPSGEVAILMTNTFWKGRSVVLEDVINIYEEYLWRNQQHWGLTDRVIPLNYVSGVDISAATWTSGTQLLDRLKTLNRVVYSPHYLDSPDRKVEDSFYTYLSTSTPTEDGTLITQTEEAGPLTRFLQAMSFSIADRITEQNEIDILYDIGKCPDEFLELLAELIGWRFIGADVDKWRVQLRNAVEIYKMKGTKRSIKVLLDTLFSTGVFNVTSDATLKELWESYIPDILYYSLATSSDAFKDFDTYTPELAKQFGVINYSHTSMETNIKYLVDKILFDLGREFPESFYLGGEKFPHPQLVVSGTGEIYTGPYHILPPTQGNAPVPVCNVRRANSPPPPPLNRLACHVPSPPPPAFLASQWPVFKTGSKEWPKCKNPASTGQFLCSLEGENPAYPEGSEFLQLQYDPNFLFYYRDRIYLVPPYEKRQYYTATIVTDNMVDRIEYYLRCYGVDKVFAKQVKDYLSENNATTIQDDTVLNNFLFFTKTKQYPPNYSTIIKNATSEKIIDPLNLLSMWNGKSSHFVMNFEASTFDWTTGSRTSTSKYGFNKVKRVLDQVIPAHAIPKILLSVSDVADAMDALADKDCREWRPNFTDLYEGSSTVTTGFGVCAVDMAALATENGFLPNRFKRTQVDNVNDVLLSGTTYQALNSANRNSLRRRNFHNLLPETKLFTRNGRNNPGSLEMSTSYYTSNIGYLPLGFIPSSLKYQDVALRQNSWGQGLGKLIDYENLDRVWNICENLGSPSSMFGYDISNTFASRAKQNVASSACNTYGRRGQLQEIIYTMNKVHDLEKYLQVSSIVSGSYLEAHPTLTQANWPTSNSLLTPPDFLSWYREPWIDVKQSMANHLINTESADDSLHYYEHFTFGSPVHKLYNVYNSSSYFSGHGLNNNYNLVGAPNFFSHTYGPFIYNSEFDIDGSTLGTSGYLAASSITYEIDIAYYGNSGVLSISGVKGEHSDLGTYAASDATDVFLTSPEFRNKNIVSSIDLVDTSTFDSQTPIFHPTFSVYNVSRDDQNIYSYAKYLINNQIIKYHRSTNPSLFPRLRIAIDNSDYGNKARNFLEPNHDYEVTVKAHNLDAANPNRIGGLSLGMWVRTGHENLNVWTYNPRLVKDECGKVLVNWFQMGLADLSSTNGINMVQQNSQIQSFNIGNLESNIGSGEGAFPALPTVTQIGEDHRCWPTSIATYSTEPPPPQAIANISEHTKQVFTFKFSTMNNKSLKASPTYTQKYDKVHRLDQKYFLEFFIKTGSTSKFVVFEEISIKDVTNYNNSIIQTKYGEVRIDANDLRAIFKFFKDLNTGSASRNSVITSGVMGASGGSRLNYRSNVSMYTNTRDGSNDQLEEIVINEG